MQNDSDFEVMTTLYSKRKSAHTSQVLCTYIKEKLTLKYHSIPAYFQ